MSAEAIEKKFNSILLYIVKTAKCEKAKKKKINKNKDSKESPYYYSGISEIKLT